MNTNKQVTYKIIKKKVSKTTTKVSKAKMAKVSDYERKLIEMQYQMRENQSYMTDAFADLDNWSKEMKVKEKEIIENPDLVKTANKVISRIQAYINFDTLKK